MFKSYYSKRKEKIVPFIKDFSRPYKHYHKKDVRKLTWNEWFWMHPSSFKLIHYGNNTINITLFTGLIIFLDNNLFRLIIGVFLVTNILQLYKKLVERKGYEEMTFYELYLRDDGS